MNNLTKTDIEKPMSGLLLMIIMTGIWTVVANAFLTYSSFKIICAFLGAEVLFFMYTYYVFDKGKNSLPESNAAKDPKEKKWFMIIFAAEGIAIFIAKNILVNISHDELFIPFFALIVGLHFFPLAKVFKRTFDYYIGAWTTAIAIAGIIMTMHSSFTQNFIGAFVSIGAAVATSCYGIKMCIDGRKILSIKNK
jgi:hypothetical protein